MCKWLLDKQNNGETHRNWSQLASDLAEGVWRSYHFLKDNRRANHFWGEPCFLQEMRTEVLQKASKHPNHLQKVYIFSWGFQIHEFVGDWLVTYYTGWFSVCSGLHLLILLFVNVLGITKRSGYIENFGINLFLEVFYITRAVNCLAGEQRWLQTSTSKDKFNALLLSQSHSFSGNLVFWF